MEQWAKLESEIYEFLEGKVAEYPNLNHLAIYNAAQAASFKILNKLENDAGIRRFENRHKKE